MNNNTLRVHAQTIGESVDSLLQRGGSGAQTQAYRDFFPIWRSRRKISSKLFYIRLTIGIPPYFNLLFFFPFSISLEMECGFILKLVLCNLGCAIPLAYAKLEFGRASSLNKQTNKSVIMHFSYINFSALLNFNCSNY